MEPDGRIGGKEVIMAKEELTPMQRQYQEMKARNKDCILFFRLGDFYEMFNEDAKLAARKAAPPGRA